MAQFVEVAFPIPIDSTFTYDLPESGETVVVGQRVLAPFHHRTMTGYVVGLPPQAGSVRTKPIHAVLDDIPILTPTLVKLGKFMSEKYGVSLGEALATLLPAGLVRQSRRRILPTGQEGEPDNVEAKCWWTRIRKSRGLDWLTTVRRDRGAAPILRQLEREGWISVESVLRPERAREQTDRLYALTPMEKVAGQRRLGKRQKEIVEFLAQKGGATTQAVLRRSLGDVAVSIRLLVKNGWLEQTKVRRSGPLPADSTFDEAPSVVLSPSQQEAAGTLRQALQKMEHRAFLLYGITGSGKTEIYLQAAARALEQGKSVIALVPEIALTPQFMGRFRARFGAEVAILHSGRTENERLSEWKRIRRGEARVVIGARSAVFAPVENLGLLVMDEEHDSSYKQEEGLTYHARELARYRAREQGAVLLFGSATPSLETFEASGQEGMELLKLPSRVTEHGLPNVKIVDLRKEFCKFGPKGMFSTALREAMTRTLERNEQVVLFLNRRGFAPTVLCPTCGSCVKCSACSVSLTYHERSATYLCHYCGETHSADSACRLCGQTKLLPLGVGTEQVERELAHHFPDSRIKRMDRDAVRSRGSYEKILSGLTRREIDILIGTQMVTKGLDLPGVSLVGVLFADQSLHFPDFRAAERTFQLITQVVGRSGRGTRKGEAYIQTFQPDHYAITAAARHEYERFFAQEREYRRELGYPPFGSLVLFELSGTNPRAVKQGAEWFAEQARKSLSASTSEIRLLGPAPAPLQRLRGRTRFHLLARAEQGDHLGALAKWWVKKAREVLAGREVALRIDIDPYRFL